MLSSIGAVVGPGKLTPFPPAYTTTQVVVSVSGQSLAGTVGTVGPEVDISTTGITISTSYGQIYLPNNAPQLGFIPHAGPGKLRPFPYAYTVSGAGGVVGLNLSSTEGTPQTNVSYSLSGQNIASTEGTPAYELDFSLTGFNVIVPWGNISLTGGAPPLGFIPQPGPGVGPFSNTQFMNLQRAITPSPTITMPALVIASTVGSPSVTILPIVSGQTITSTEGTPGQQVSYIPAGFTITSSEGLLTYGISLGLIGQKPTFRVGTVVPTGGLTIVSRIFQQYLGFGFMRLGGRL
jgi:hypothetical protein